MKKEFKDRVSILCVAYHNLAVEQEFCKMFGPALESYKNAATFAYRYFGTDNALYTNMKNVYDKAKKALNEHIRKQIVKV